MTTVFNRTKTMTIIVLTAAMVLWSVGLFAFPMAAKAATLTAGDLIKGSGSAVYYYAGDMTRYVFVNEKTYKTWYSDFSGVKTITDEELAAISLSGKNVTYRAGTNLVKIETDPKVYAVEPNGVLRWVETEAVAKALYGDNWAKRVHDLSDSFFANYTVGTSISSAKYPTGTLVMLSGGTDTYYINASGQKQKVSAMDENRFKSEYVVTATDLTSYADGTAIAAADTSLIDTSQGGGTTVPPVTGSTLAVALASTSPAATSIVADTTSGDGAQALASMAAFNFTAGSDGDVKVTALKLKRGGISTDTSLANVYLYEGDTRIATNTSVSSTVISFNSGFTVSKGTTKTVAVKIDLANGSAASQTMNLSVNAVSDITTDGATVTGTFPVTANTMTTAAVADLGKVTIANVSPASATTVDPGVTSRELWRFSVASADQKIELHKFRTTMVGTIASGDLANLGLYEGGTQLGSTVAALGSDNSVTFDLSAAPLTLTAGTTKNLSLKGDVVSGSSRNFYFSFQAMSDIVAKDTNYGVYIKPNQADTFSVVSSSTTTINSGSLSISKASDPSGNVAIAATNVTIAKFNVKATGEDVKISALTITPTITGGGAANMKNGKLFLDGTQVGTTQTLASGTAASYSLGNSFIATAGKEMVLTVVADIIVNSGTAFAASDTVTIQITSGTATGQRSLGSVSISAVSSNTLTVASGTAAVAASGALGNATSSLPTGVSGATNALIGKFVVTAGSGEGIRINSLAFKSEDSTTKVGTSAIDWGGVFSNVRLVKGGADVTQSANLIGSTVAVPSTTAGSSYTFTPSTAIEVAKSAQYTFDVYGDIKSNADTTGTAFYGVVFDDLSYTGVDTNTSTTYGTDTAGQQVYIASAGTLSAAIDGNTAIAAYLIMGKTGVSLAKFKLSASAAENLTVKTLVVSDSTSATGSLVNLKLKVDGTQIGSIVDSLSTTSAATNTISSTTYNTGYAVFDNLTLSIPKGGYKVVEVVADVNAYPNAGSNSVHYLSLLNDYQSTSGTQASITYYGSTGSTSTGPSSTINGNEMKVYRTGLTVTVSSSSPSGARTTSATDRVALFNFTADSAYEVSLSSVTVNFSGTAAPTSGTVTVYLKEYSSNSYVTIAGASGTFTWASSPTALAIAPTSAITIASGTTKTLAIELDSLTTTFSTGSSGSTKSFVARITTLTWNDSVSNVTPLTAELPYYASTLQY